MTLPRGGVGDAEATEEGQSKWSRPLSSNPAARRQRQPRPWWGRPKISGKDEDFAAGDAQNKIAELLSTKEAFKEVQGDPRRPAAGTSQIRHQAFHGRSCYLMLVEKRGRCRAAQEDDQAEQHRSSKQFNTFGQGRRQGNEHSRRPQTSLKGPRRFERTQGRLESRARKSARSSSRRCERTGQSCANSRPKQARLRNYHALQLISNERNGKTSSSCAHASTTGPAAPLPKPSRPRSNELGEEYCGITPAT